MTPWQTISAGSRSRETYGSRTSRSPSWSGRAATRSWSPRSPPPGRVCGPGGGRLRERRDGGLFSGTGIEAAIGIGDLHATLIAACAVRCLGGSSSPASSLGTTRSGRWWATPHSTSTAWRSWRRRPTSRSRSPVSRVGRCCPASFSAAGTRRPRRSWMSSRHATVRRLTTHHHRSGSGSQELTAVGRGRAGD